MSELFFVRHGQASFGAEQYDKLSELGYQQSCWLGEYFDRNDISFDQIVIGDMVRHRETATGICEGMGLKQSEFATDQAWNEFDFQALLKAYVHQYPDQKPTDESSREHYYRLLKKALHMWSENGFEKTVPETWAEFDQRVREGMKLLTDSVTAKQKILVVSSGGAISMALSHVLKAPAETMIQLNLQTRNSSVSHCFYSNTAISLSSFNHLPHLEQADRRYAITYA